MRKKNLNLKELKVIERRLKMALQGLREGIELMEDLGTPTVYVDEHPCNRVVTFVNQVMAKAGMDPSDDAV